MNLNVLAIDTSTDAYSVACCCGGKIIEHFEVAPYKHSLFILEAVKKILVECNLAVAQLDCVAFAHGPGSFTGLRLAASVVQGLAMAYNLPVVPISTLQTIAQGAYVEHKAENVLVGIDARMHEIYWGVYNLAEDGYMQKVVDDALIAPNKVVIPSQFTNKQTLGIGNAWEVYGDVLQECCRVSTIVKENCYPHARYVLMLAEKNYRGGKVVAAAEALPVYLRDEVTHKKE
jgi:tRNA threonylcarbamoyladenosine biosynthesis protein TsaB